MFANSTYETKTETETAFAAGWVKQFGNIEFLILSIGSVVFFTLLLVTGNTMAISVRERIGELAVLKAVGFSDRAVLVLVLAESILIAVIGGALGLIFAAASQSPCSRPHSTDCCRFYSFSRRFCPSASPSRSRRRVKRLNSRHRRHAPARS